MRCTTTWFRRSRQWATPRIPSSFGRPTSTCSSMIHGRIEPIDSAPEPLPDIWVRGYRADAVHPICRNGLVRKHMEVHCDRFRNTNPFQIHFHNGSVPSVNVPVFVVYPV